MEDDKEGSPLEDISVIWRIGVMVSRHITLSIYD